METEQQIIQAIHQDLARIITSAVRAARSDESKIDDKPNLKKKLLTPKDIRREFGIHSKLLAYWRRQGIGPAYVTFGRRIYYERPVFEKFVAAGRVKTTGWVAE
jgi:hypothetical protein